TNISGTSKPKEKNNKSFRAICEEDNEMIVSRSFSYIFRNDPTSGSH
ncbi:hypothetical protein PanWU01x14_289300, partial [Parasponia andersonii]